MTGERCGVGRSNGGWGEGDDDDPADWGPPVAVDTRDRLASSESATEDESPLLLPPVTPTRERREQATIRTTE